MTLYRRGCPENNYTYLSIRTRLRMHEQMHEAYQKQKFDEAIYICNRLMRHFDGKMQNYYNMWIERCEYMKTQDLPEDWNGVFIATTK